MRWIRVCLPSAWWVRSATSDHRLAGAARSRQGGNSGMLSTVLRSRGHNRGLGRTLLGTRPPWRKTGCCSCCRTVMTTVRGRRCSSIGPPHWMSTAADRATVAVHCEHCCGSLLEGGSTATAHHQPAASSKFDPRLVHRYTPARGGAAHLQVGCHPLAVIDNGALDAERFRRAGYGSSRNRPVISRGF